MKYDVFCLKRIYKGHFKSTGGIFRFNFDGLGGLEGGVGPQDSHNSYAWRGYGVFDFYGLFLVRICIFVTFCVSFSKKLHNFLASLPGRGAFPMLFRPLRAGGVNNKRLCSGVLQCAV